MLHEVYNMKNKEAKKTKKTSLNLIYYMIYHFLGGKQFSKLNIQSNSSEVTTNLTNRN